MPNSVHGKGNGNSRASTTTGFPIRILPLAIALASANTALAANFDLGPVSATASGSISAGALMSMETAAGRWTNARNAELIGAEFSGDANPWGAVEADDSRLNWEKGDIVSSPVTLLGELELKYDRYGFFIRGKAWYDYTLDNKKVPHGNSLNLYQRNATLEDDGFHDLAQFKGVELLDAYVYGDFDAGSVPVHVRVGNQVVNWGEGLFFQNGINAINPIDVAAFRRPGSQLKEALLPTPLAYFNAGLTDSLSMEGFYQLAWNETVLEGCGTFFSGIDYFPGDCYGVSRKGPGTPYPNPADYNDAGAYAQGSYIRRGPDSEPSDSGQFGLALRYFDWELGAEFGLYAMQIHSRTPQPSAILSSDPNKNAPNNPGWEYNGVDGGTADSAYYFKDYAEDIRVFGVTVSANVAGWSVFGEYSFRPNQPIIYHTGDTVPDIFGATANLDALGAPLTGAVLAAAPGSVFEGYGREKVSQLSIGGIQTFSQVLGADDLVFIAEAGMKYVHDLPSLDEVRYGRPDAFGSNLAASQGEGSVGCNLGVHPQYQGRVCSDDGFVTDFSWGYRMRGQLNYKGLMAGINVSPFAAFGHDVEGYSHDNNFVEGRLLGNVGVKADYLAKYSAELSYTTTGGAFWSQNDRDFLALSARMNF
ncbi:DUF1302 domain-containing protein [Marinobacter mobilis]|uniref:DUF1302 domain-containing protein n=1 Tax=Marinobacter mobilis TaxID=488533 RepID=A0A1H2XX83_9GAMM|nr:DUF1302 domain-containing protein [Marinobacter mobilis]SDW97447.1 Protein of unknown function [Marinobacter mobilis]